MGLYPCSVNVDVDPRVATLKRLLDAEVERQVSLYLGCWPLGVGVGGVLLGLALLAGIL